MSHSELLVFALGPVQSFIATARRTQDLWLGSQLLSLLARVGLDSAVGQPDVSALFPVQHNNAWPDSIPNRFIVQVPAGQAQAVARKIENVIGAAWHSPQGGGVAEQVEQYLMGLTNAGHSWRTIWRRQVGSWLETYWAAWPWDGVAGSYGEAYKRASQALMMRKHLRAYPTSAEPGERCSLCGVRQALCEPSHPELRTVREFWATIARHRDVTAAELRAGERLCAICTIKRFASRAGARVGGHPIQIAADRFPSTSSIAAAGFRSALITHWDQTLDDGTTLGQKVLDYFKLLDALGPREGGGRTVRFGRSEAFPYLIRQSHNGVAVRELLSYDGDFFYDETLTPERLKELLGREPDEPARRKALSGLNELLAAARACKIGPPPIYLAVLSLDGDRIGATLGDCEQVEQHTTISQALSQFSSVEAPDIIERQYPGRLIYAGGDDVLALLPLSADTSQEIEATPDILIVADRLRAALAAALTHTAGIEVTASCGIALLHHMQPLEGGIRAAHRAETRAKEEYGRRALAVEVLRRSGEHQGLGMQWENLDRDELRVPLITALRQAIVRGALSGKVGYDLEQIVPVFTPTYRTDIPARVGLANIKALERVLESARDEEMKRLFKRRTDEKNEAQADADKVPALAKQVVALTESITLGETARWVLLARFLAQGGEV